MQHWQNKLLYFYSETGRWDKEKDMTGFTAFSISLLKELTGAYMALQVVLEDAFTARISDAIPEYLNELVLHPAPISQFLEANHYDNVYWQQIPYNDDTFTEILTALSSAVMIPVTGESSTSIIVLGWSEVQVCDEHFRNFIDSAGARVRNVLQQSWKQQQLQQSVSRFTAILQQMPQAVIFIDETTYTGWVNSQAAALLQLSSTGEQPPNILGEAMAKLRNSAINREDINRQASQLFTLSNQTITNWLWTFGNNSSTQQYSVFTQPVSLPDVNGRLWVFNLL
ncbi:hypothetical protein [Deminuibacter soli]|uniref:PAS domain-containing protein n=1 Tax=Deminuibacter soli TaxID=2291815 RepID=A0A3E1NEF4_9BACT|nr:hypothetical protein [Deminuibacter soli]RFM26359.1 hypothetical protein DXN05_20845 [Deminuibacter soli]